MSYYLNKSDFDNSSISKKKFIKYVESTHIKVYRTADNLTRKLFDIICSY